MKHPGTDDLRITQLLYNLGVTIKADETPAGYLLDNYNESDDVILKRVNMNIKKLKDGKKQEITC